MSENQLGRPRHIISWAIIGFAVLAVLSIGLFWFFVPRPYPGYFYPSHFFFLPFGWFFGLFWIFIIFWAVRWIFWPRRWGYSRGYWRYGDESYYILRQRYARGEITKEQFEQMMRDLREHT